MDYSVHSHEKEVDRAINNVHAWKNLSGYRTTSGCPCWDRSKNMCIPKRRGWGYNINFWCLLGCFICEPADNTVIPEGTQSHRLSARHSLVLNGNQLTHLSAKATPRSERTEFKPVGIVEVKQVQELENGNIDSSSK